MLTDNTYAELMEELNMTREQVDELIQVVKDMATQWAGQAEQSED